MTEAEEDKKKTKVGVSRMTWFSHFPFNVTFVFIYFVSLNKEEIDGEKKKKKKKKNWVDGSTTELLDYFYSLKTLFWKKNLPNRFKEIWKKKKKKKERKS